MEALKPNEQRAKNAIILIWIVLALEIAKLVSGYFQYNLLQSVANGIAISTETANSNDLREQVISIFYLIAFIISAITFIMWFRRSYFNLHQKTIYLSHTEGWAAGSWFAPIISLYRPYQIMKELYQQTRSILADKGISINNNFTTAYLGWWWALWIMSRLIGQFVFRYSLKAETIDELSISTIAEMVDCLVGIPLALITIKIIKDYACVEPLLKEIDDDGEKTNIYDLKA